MEKLDVAIVSNWSHCSQILAGLLMLQKNGRFTLNIYKEQGTRASKDNCAIVRAKYKGMRIIYDVADGYGTGEWMRDLLDDCDFYFKRSYSTVKNDCLFHNAWANKMHPLGFNYHVTCEGNPYNYSKASVDEMIKNVLGKKKNSYFTCDKFETNIVNKSKEFKIIFLPDYGAGGGLSPEANNELYMINENRIKIIRILQSKYRDQFVGGLQDTKIAREMASDLIVNRWRTNRAVYLKLMKESDICIGTIGLDESIGWKTGEYVAASKAIVNETFHYEVPGNFAVGKNYLNFDDFNECVEAVQYLIDNPSVIYEMKMHNREYYLNYLKPDVLILRTLEMVDKYIEKGCKEL